MKRLESKSIKSAELHKGEEVVQDIPVYANTELKFAPEGYHVVLIGLKQELHEGDEIEAILQFRDHEEIAIKVSVGEATDHEHAPWSVRFKYKVQPNRLTFLFHFN